MKTITQLEKENRVLTLKLNKMRHALQSIVSYPRLGPQATNDGYPHEVTYDEYAYKRMVDSYRLCASQTLTDCKGIK